MLIQAQDFKYIGPQSPGCFLSDGNGAMHHGLGTCGRACWSYSEWKAKGGERARLPISFQGQIQMIQLPLTRYSLLKVLPGSITGWEPSLQ